MEVKDTKFSSNNGENGGNVGSVKQTQKGKPQPQNSDKPLTASQRAKIEPLATTYVRIGTNFFKWVEEPKSGGGFSRELYEWKKEFLIADYGRKRVEEEVPTYDGAKPFPSHTNFRQSIGNFYNTYQPIIWKPKEGACTVTFKFLKHIFGEQYTMGLEYLKLLYEQPTQLLPVLALVSKKTQTGKTSFLKYLEKIFGHNYTNNTNKEFDADFNDDWSSKLIIGVDEADLSNPRYYNEIKRLTTANKNKTKTKFIKTKEMEFFGKFVLTFNPDDEKNKLPIAREETTRFWVREVPQIEGERRGRIEDELEKEIPAFLHFLLNLEYKHKDKNNDRFWFSGKEIREEDLPLKFFGYFQLNQESGLAIDRDPHPESRHFG